MLEFASISMTTKKSWNRRKKVVEKNKRRGQFRLMPSTIVSDLSNG